MKPHRARRAFSGDVPELILRLRGVVGEAVCTEISLPPRHSRGPASAKKPTEEGMKGGRILTLQPESRLPYCSSSLTGKDRFDPEDEVVDRHWVDRGTQTHKGYHLQGELETTKVEGKTRERLRSSPGAKGSPECRRLREAKKAMMR